MLSVAKHLLFLIENKQKQIPRSARDDIDEAFFISLLSMASPLCTCARRSSSFHVRPRALETDNLGGDTQDGGRA